MKGIRTWAWPDADAIAKQLRRASWGSSFWTRYGRRKFNEQAQRQLKRQMAVMRVYAVPQDSIARPPAPVVH